MTYARFRQPKLRLSGFVLERMFIMKTLDTIQKGIILTASVSCMNLFNLKEDIRRVHASNVSMLHFDVVDGRFNDCIILGTPTLKALRPHTHLPIEVHLAVYEPEKYIKQFADAGADYIAVHYESDTKKNLLKCIDKICSLDMRPVLALKAQTSTDDDIIELSKHVSWILKLTVEPGFSGQTIKNESYERIRELRQALNDEGLPLRIQADGNVNEKTIPKLVESGADILTGGTSGLFLPGIDVNIAADRLLIQANYVLANRQHWRV